MARLFYIGFIVLVGSFWAPSAAYACGSACQETTEACCSDTASKGHCCGDEDGGCQGKCGHKSCHCSTVVAFAMVPQVLSPQPLVVIHSFKKQTFTDTRSILSTGFYSVFLPPKIG